MTSKENFDGTYNSFFAGWWTLLLARTFGKKVCTIDDWAGKRTIMTAYRWRGVLYVTRIDTLDGDERPR